MKYEYLQTLLVIYAQEDMELLQFDIKIDFLHPSKWRDLHGSAFGFWTS